MSTSTSDRTFRFVAAGVVSVYLALTLTLSYAVWAPYDGLEHDPAWASDDRLWPALVVLHVVAGAAIGRWWALALPVVWALLSVPAGGYDTPVWIGIAFNLPFFWLPATLLGIALRKAIGCRTNPRAAGAFLVLAGLAGAVLVAVWSQVPSDPSDRPPARYETLDEERGAYGGVRLGDDPERIFERFGPRRQVGEEDYALPTALGIEDDVDRRPTSGRSGGTATRTRASGSIRRTATRKGRRPTVLPPTRGFEACC